MQTLYNALLENNCSEQASRMAAMESSTKNATEMISKLSLQYNRWGSQQMWQSRKHFQCCCCILGSADQCRCPALQNPASNYHH